jgi:hypothetical protein
MNTELEPDQWLARDFGTDPAAGLDGVTAAIIERTRLSNGDEAAVRTILNVAAEGSAWRALQLQEPLNITILGAMQAAATAAHPSSSPDIVVEAVLNQVCLAMFPGWRAAGKVPPVVPEGHYLSQWWQTHVRHSR